MLVKHPVQVRLRDVVKAPVHGLPALQEQRPSAVLTKVLDLLPVILGRFPPPALCQLPPAHGRLWEQHGVGGGHLAEISPPRVNARGPGPLKIALVGNVEDHVPARDQICSRYQERMVKDVAPGVVVQEDVPEGSDDQLTVFLEPLREAGPEAQLLPRELRKGIFADLLKLGMQKRLPSHHADHVVEPLKGVHRLLEILEIHVIRFCQADVPCAVRAPVLAHVRDFDLDGVIVSDGFHSFSLILF